MNDDCVTLALRSDDASATIELSGELDLATADLLTAAVVQLCDDGATAVTLDMASLTFIDSSGLSALLRSRQSATIRLMNIPDQLRRLLEITSTGDLFD